MNELNQTGGSIEIIGSNGSKLKLITEDKIESIIDENEITYNLYKSKYTKENKLTEQDGEKCINSSNHLLKQLIKSFSTYNDDLSFDDNLKNFSNILNKINNTNNIIEIINIFFIQNNVLYKLENAIYKIIKKINKKYTPSGTKCSNGKLQKQIKLNNNYYLDLLLLQYFLKQIKDEKITSHLDKLVNSINDLNEYLDKISIIVIKKKSIDNSINCITTPNNIINILDNYLDHIKIIKGNILKIDSLINIIIEDIYKFYNII